MIEQEQAIFATAHQDYEAAFAQLFELYCQALYPLTLEASLYNEAAAQQFCYEVFSAAHKFIHTFQPQQISFKLYLFSLLADELFKRAQPIPSTHDILPRKLRQAYTAEEYAIWQVIQALPVERWLLVELWYGSNLSLPELSLVLKKPLAEVQQLQAQASHQLHKILPTFAAHITTLYQKRNRFAELSKRQQVRLLRLLLERKRLRLTFIHYTWWQRLLRPGSLATLAIISMVIAGSVLAVRYRESLHLAVSEPSVPSTTTMSSFLRTVITERRPSISPQVGELPDVTTNRSSLVAVTDNLYGSGYVSTVTTEADTDDVQPEFTVNITAEDYIPVATAYTYRLPEALTEDQLQYAALRHFVSLPLNQFTYVNGTYYIEEDGSEFRPLFIAFTNTGSIDFQMRQAAICDLNQLTEPIADTQAQTDGYDFLLSHHFVEVKPSQLQITQVSSPERTVPKDAFCQDGDTTAVQDREVVYYLPHTLLRFGENHNDVLALRQRGLAVQLHGKHITNLRVDPLFLLLQYADRSDASVTIKPLSQAITELQQYRYSSERNNQVFPQWNHSHGNDRFKTMVVESVRLEYVYDELNHLIEPYYVFTGLGTDLNDQVITTNWYVVASTQAIELRAPYRE